MFDKGCNLINEANKVLSVVVPAIGPGPFSIVLQENQEIGPQVAEGFITLDPGHKIQVRSSALIIGQITIYLNQARIWDPHLSYQDIKLNTVQNALPKISQRLIDHSPKSSLAGLLWMNDKDPFQVSVENQLPYLKKGFESANLDVLKRVAQNVAGVGVGLTPAGDDFLVGVMIGMRVAGRDAVVEPLVNALADTAIPQTTALSGAWLRAAARGEAGLAWHNLLESIQREDEPEQLTQAIKTIISYGQTSGADALFGFLTAAVWLTQSQ